MTSRDGHLTVWHGDYAFGQDNTFFPAAVLLGRKYADKEPDRRPPEVEFRKAVLGGVPVATGSPTLRAAIYGDGEAMLLESQVQKAARAAAPRAAKVIDGQRSAYVGDETYVGVEVVDAVQMLAQSSRST